MDRQLLIDLIQKGLIEEPGKHHLWVSKCFEITVRPDEVVLLDEYEGYATREKGAKKLFHVGRSILRLKEGTVAEEAGSAKPWR